MRSLGIVCVLLVWLSCVVCKEWWDNDVKSINADNILELIGKKKHVIVKFYTPWCYFCKKMNTDYEQLNDKYKDSE
jgi:thiol-disulfide isomerase/thioredoxin